MDGSAFRCRHRWCAVPRGFAGHTPASTRSMRRSTRIAVAPREANTTKQAQRVLMKKLGVALASPAVDSEGVRKYKRAFCEPLTDYGHDALQTLLSGDIDPISLDLNVLGLEDHDL